MDSCCCLFYSTTRAISFPVLHHRSPPISFRRRPSIVTCYYGGLLEPRTPAGKLLTGVVLDGRDDFHVVARKELQRIAAQRDEAVARLHISAGSDEAVLHRRIAEIKKSECQDEVEDVMYAFILRKFSEMRVHLTPSLTKCIYNHRLEIWPSKDWELESIHSFEVLQMVREHLTAAIGLKPNANIREHWAATQIRRLQLCKLYTASILYGYFLKSASLRHQLEWSLGQSQTNSNLSSCSSRLSVSEATSLGSEYIAFGRISSSNSTSTSQASLTYKGKWENLRHYVMSFDADMIQMCANPKSMEALNLIERHSCALFGDEKTGLMLETDELIDTSFASLKRFILEAVAFGSFLWDTEDQVSDVYTLEDNNCCR